jgi:CheY-like chemotaxis protein
MKNVLLVDDDSIANFLNTKTLERMGYANQIDTALNGQEALSLFNEYYQGTRQLPDLILLDINMPIMDGFEFLEAFRKLRLPRIEEVRVVIVTTSSHPNDLLRAKALGVKHYLTKPLTPELLLKAFPEDEGIAR